MSTTMDQAFITQFELDVHLAYQQKGSKLRQTVRRKTGVRGSTVRFQKLGKGVAQQKTRHGDVPVMNAVHSYVEAVLADWYGGDYVDKLDELKTNIDERQIQVDTGAYAVGRKVDDIIITQLDATTTEVAVGTTGLTKAKIFDAFEKLNNVDVPDDGQRFAVVGAHQWDELLNLQQFASADYVGKERLPFVAGTQAIRWLNIIWFLHSGLPLVSTTRKCFMYHMSAVGLGENEEVKTDISWVPQKAAFFINNMVSAGAKLIDAQGVVEIQCVDTAAIS